MHAPNVTPIRSCPQPLFDHLAAVIIIAAILLDTWWATGIALADVFAITGAIAWIVAQMIGDE